MKAAEATGEKAKVTPLAVAQIYVPSRILRTTSHTLQPFIYPPSRKLRPKYIHPLIFSPSHIFTLSRILHPTPSPPLGSQRCPKHQGQGRNRAIEPTVERGRTTDQKRHRCHFDPPKTAGGCQDDSSSSGNSSGSSSGGISSTSTSTSGCTNGRRYGREGEIAATRDAVGRTSSCRFRDLRYIESGTCCIRNGQGRHMPHA